MFKNNVMKKLSIVFASVAVVIPVATSSVSAKQFHHARHYHVARVYKRTHAQHFYKSSTYLKSWRHAEHFMSYHRWINKALNVGKQNYAYRVGFNNALHAHADMKLVRNKDYRNGFVVALVANNNEFRFTKHAFKLSQIQYQQTVLNGEINRE